MYMLVDLVLRSVHRFMFWFVKAGVVAGTWWCMVPVRTAFPTNICVATGLTVRATLTEMHGCRLGHERRVSLHSRSEYYLPFRRFLRGHSRLMCAEHFLG